MLEIINRVLNNFVKKLADFTPDFFAGLFILFFGIIFANFIKKIVITLLIFLKIDSLLQRTKLLAKNHVRTLINTIAEILKWAIIIVFLIPTLEVWGLSKATVVLNQLLWYLPNVIISIIIGFIGLVVANLSGNFVLQSLKTSNNLKLANTLAVATKSILVFFTALIVLSQLGVAQDLIRILFTGIVAMLAIAGGLAFGLGGKEIAKELLEELRKKIA
jgi:hypothetical protein